MNAIDSGWSVTKKEDTYVFKKKHEGKQEVFMADYLEKFIDKNMKLIIQIKNIILMSLVYQITYWLLSKLF